jgi:polyisoprenoid-binding protein YceI
MKRLLLAGAAMLAAACSPQPQNTVQKATVQTSAESAALPAPATAAAAPVTAPAGSYKLDLAHTSVNFRVSHLGLSNYTARFTRMDGELNFDPANPAASSVRVRIDPRSLQTNYPEPRKLDFDAQIQKEFLDAARFPDLGFRSSKVELTGARTAKITGDLTLHGVTRPVVLEASFNGGYPAGGFDPSGARIGFSAKGAFRRSDFGITYGVPAPGTNLGVSDQVEVAIETEFTQAPQKAKAAS